MNERTLVVLKPDAVERRMIGAIVGYFERAGLDIVACDIRTVSRDFVKLHYPDSMAQAIGKKSARPGSSPCDYDEQGKRVLCWLRDYISRGRVVAMVLEGHDAVRRVRQVVGSTDPSAAEPGTIRGGLGSDSVREANAAGRACENLVHASGTPEEAAREISLWFGDALRG